MKDLVYKFLDSYAGDGVVCEKEPPIYNPLNFQPINDYTRIKTNNGTLVCRIRPSHTGDVFVKLLPDLIRVVSGFFSIDARFSAQYIYEWFLKKQGIKNNHELAKYLLP